jgi:hypothetical protein
VRLSRRCLTADREVSERAAACTKYRRGLTKQTGRNPHSIVTVITARSALEVTICSMGGDGLSPKHLCPGCGRLMGLSRIVPASPGSSELRTYGCKECGVWVTEGSTPRVAPREISARTRSSCPNKPFKTSSVCFYLLGSGIRWRILVDTSLPCVCLFDPN